MDQTRNNGRKKPIPQLGWWKGLSTTKFREQMDRFFDTVYRLDEIEWTHDFLENGVIIGEVGMLEEVIGDPSPWVAETSATALAFVHRTDLICLNGPYVFYQELDLVTPGPFPVEVRPKG